MFIKNNLAKTAAFVLAIGMIGASCQKMERPALPSNYAQDANPPGGPLKFFAAYDKTNVDSIRANFGTDNNVTYVDGVSGKAMQAGANGYVVYPSANDFKRVTSFTIAFWMKKNGPNPAGGGTSFVFGLATSTDIWTRQDMFLEFEDAGNPSTAALAAAKFYVKDQWFEFTGARRIPNILDNQWHHLAFVFDQATSTVSFYKDGAPLSIPGGLPANFGKFNNNGGVMDLNPSSGIVVGGPGHFAVGKTPDSWMGNFNGAIDQFRMYGSALSAADVAALYNGKK